MNIHGTSPPAWGKLLKHEIENIRMRYIPTRVGKTSKVGFTLDQFNGTSPPAWGKLDIQWLNRLWTRYIPTRVGKTARLDIRAPYATVHPHPRGENEILDRTVGKPAVHPHPRGENSAITSQNIRRAGTSPPAWGKHLDISSRRLVIRYIPTRVGKTVFSFAK